MKTNSRPMRVIATILAFALVHGTFAPQAWSQVVAIGSVGAPVGGSAAAAVNAPGASAASIPALSLQGANLTGALSAAPAIPAPLAGLSALNAAVAAPAAAPVAGAQVQARAAAAAAAPSALSPAAAAAAKDEPSRASEEASAARTPATKIESGPRTSRAAAKAESIIAGVKRFFGGKSAESVESAPSATPEAIAEGTLSAPHASELEPSTSNDPTIRTLAATADSEPPAPQQPEGPKKKGKGWFGLGATVAALIGGMLIMQLGLEGQGAAMAKLTEDAFGDFSILAQVAIFASIGSMVGQQLAEFFRKKFGLTQIFYGAHALRAVSLATMVFLLGTGMMPLPMMFAFYALNGIVTGVAVTAEGTLRKFLLAQQGVSQQKFRTMWQFLAEIIAVPAPMILGALVASVGASWITALYPATILMGLMLFFMLKVVPWKAAQRIENLVAAAGAVAPQEAAPAPSAPKVGIWQRIKNAFKQIFSNMEEGKDFVFKNAVLKYSLAGAVIFDMMNVLIYRLITPGYGKLVAGSEGMAAVQGNLVGMFSLGGLLLAAFFLVLEKRDKKKNEGKSEAELAAVERSSMLRWTLLGIPALALLSVMAFNLALPFAPVMFMDINWVPSTVLAAALIPFGFMQVAASIKLNSYFQERLPSDSGKVQKALAFSGSSMTALSIVLMLALKPLFGDIAAFNPFPYLAAALVPLGAALFYIQRKLAGATKPENLKLAADLPGEKTAGGFVGVLLGVIAAALLLSFMPFIPGVGGALAGLGVLGKFLVHLAVALALPVGGWFGDRAIRKRSK